jgi:D-3-phosphoglycerate dehydrogenase
LLNLIATGGEPMRYRCAILDDYQNVALKLADWSILKDQVEVTVFNDKLAGPDAVIKALADFDIVCIMRERTPFPRQVIEALPKLKLLISSGMRNASVDRAAAAERNIAVAGTRGHGNPTVGVTFGLILELTRRIGFENARMKAGAWWQTTVGTDIGGKTLGIVGLGNLGKAVARVGQAFGMKVIAWSQNLTPERCAEAGVGYAAREQLFAEADVITVHLQLSERSRGLISTTDLGRMKPTAYIVNTSRGPIIDEAALIETLSARRIAGAGLDVFGVEPLPGDHPFRRLENVVLTPHLGYVTEESYRVFFREMVEAIAAFLGGKPVPRPLSA